MARSAFSDWTVPKLVRPKAKHAVLSAPQVVHGAANFVVFLTASKCPHVPTAAKDSCLGL